MRLAKPTSYIYISLMTEKTDNTVHNDATPAAIDAFILQWGDLGGQWGVNRSVSQVHAFLYLQDEPITADRIAAEFGMARSNVSNSLKELQVWNLVRRVPVKGDRRDHFVAETDVWQIAQRIAEGRKLREIDPALKTLRNCVSEAEDDPNVSDVQRKRLKAMRDFMEKGDRWYSQVTALPVGKLEALMTLGAKVARFLPERK